MNNNIVAAVFPDRTSAERAISGLRSMGVPDSSISVVAQHEGETHTQNLEADNEHHGDNTASGTLKGVGIGAGVGALFGLAAAFIPGVGPFITAGALAETLGAAAGGAAAGAIVGGTTGGVVGMLEDYGVSNEEATHYASEIERGGVFVGVSTATGMVNEAEVRRVIQDNGGKTSAYMA